MIKSLVEKVEEHLRESPKNWILQIVSREVVIA
jgi:hypothetical protein